MENAVLEITYSFQFADGMTEDFHVAVDTLTGDLLNAPHESSASWTQLEYKKCGDCKLTAGVTCPVAVSLESLVDAFRKFVSYETATISVRVGEKTLTKKASLQDGLQSIFGLLMVTSGCPAFARLKPMARFHHPFASPEETFYRVTSMHMLAQYFRQKDGLPVDFSFADLQSMYEEIHRVNVDFLKRIKRAGEEDAHVHGVVNLDSLALMMPMLLEDELETLRPLFAAHLRKK